MVLILNSLTPMHWAFAGAAIAGITLALLSLANRRLGISTGFEDICSLALPLPYFQRKNLVAARTWRLPFVAGLVIGGALSAMAGGGWQPTWALGRFDDVIGLGEAGKVAWMFAGGLFIGVGTRMAGGCTSGHGIFGLSNREWPSLVATVSFMAAGVVTTQLVYRVIFWADVMALLYIALGVAFGFVLSRSGAADYDFIQAMFLFENLQLYGIMGTAVVVAMPGLWWLQRRTHTLLGAPLTVDRKAFSRGTVVGGLLFGVGWSITGMCPGPIFVNIGEGKIYALAALAGALTGTALFGAAYPRLQKLFRLPAISVGTGEG